VCFDHDRIHDALTAFPLYHVLFAVSVCRGLVTVLAAAQQSTSSQGGQ